MLETLALAAVVLGSVAIYNRLVRLREQADAAWADVDVQLKRRHDLIPNLVETVKGYASHEEKTLEAVVQARGAAMNASGPAESSQAEGLLAGALKSVFALSEAYPDLYASQGFRELQVQLGNLEDEVQQARRYYNAVVRDLNTKIHQVPSNVVARAFGFDDRDFFEIPDGEKEVPKVDFGAA